MAQDRNKLEFWESQIRHAQEYLEAGGRLQRWQRYREWYENKYPEGVVAVNLVFAVGRALVPQLYFKQPTILVVPRKPGLSRQAKILESIDGWLINHMGMKSQLKLGIIDAFLSNLAVYKFGYHSIATELPTQRSPERTPEQLLLALEDFLGPAVAQQVEEENEELAKFSYHDWVKPDSPWMLRVQPEDFLVPFGTLDVPGAPWGAFRVVRPLEDVKADTIYENTKDLQPNAQLNVTRQGVKSPNERRQEHKIDAVELFEIWDKRDRRIRVFSEGHKKWLRNEKHNLHIDGLPVETLQFNPSGWDFWGESDAHQIWQQVVEYNETRTLEIKHKRSAITKFGYDKNRVDPAELAKFTSGELVAFGVDGPPGIAMSEIRPGASPDLYRVDERIRDDVRDILGFSRNQAGEFDVSRRTATEAAIVQQAAQLRSDERRDQMADLIASAFQRKVHPMIFEYWTAQRVIEVTALDQWIKFTGPEIKGDYQVVAVPDSVVPVTKAQRQQMAQQVLALFRGDPRVDQRRLYQWALEQFEGIIPDDLLVPEEQLQQQIAREAILQQMRAAQGNGQQQPQGAPSVGQT